MVRGDVCGGGSLISEAYPLRGVSNGKSDRRRDVLVFAACINQDQFIFSDELIIRRVVYGQGVWTTVISERRPSITRKQHLPRSNYRHISRSLCAIPRT